jgi:hypothetical protein
MEFAPLSECRNIEAICELAIIFGSGVAFSARLKRLLADALTQENICVIETLGSITRNEPFHLVDSTADCLGEAS